MTPIIIRIITLSLSFDFLNGIHDSSNIVAKMIASQAFHPHTALGVTAVAEFLGPLNLSGLGNPITLKKKRTSK